MDPRVLLGCLLTVLRQAEKEHSVIVFTETKNSAKFFYDFANANKISNTHLFTVSRREKRRDREGKKRGERGAKGEHRERSVVARHREVRAGCSLSLRLLFSSSLLFLFLTSIRHKSQLRNE